jgi:Zn-dependent metalloprotease
MRFKILLKGSKQWLLIFSCTLFFINSFAQKTQQQLEALRQKVLSDQMVSQLEISAERQTPSLIVFGSERPTRYKKAEMPQLLQSYLSLRAGYDNMVPVKETRLFQQLQVPEYQQYFKGVKVEYSRYKALARNEDLYYLAGSFYEIDASLSVMPGITEAQALQFAKANLPARKYAWEEVQEKLQVTTDQRVRNILLKELQEYLPKAELVIVRDFGRKDIADMRLAYKFNLYAADPLARAYIFVDAQTGKILLHNKIIKHASVPTTVPTRYAGNRTIYTKQISGNDPNNGLPLVSSHPTTEPTYIPGSPTYVLIDDTRGQGIETYDLNNVGGLPLSVAALYAQGKSFTDVDNNWTLAEHKRSPTEGGAAEAENDDIAWDAHWGAEMVYDYWKLKHSRLSYDGKDSKIKSYIHYGPAYDNAFWNGSVMTYGDGSGTSATGFKALTSLDVCGHEIGHGVCSSTSDLVYEKESGAMNEGFSDIWAACVENFAIKNVDPTLAARYKPFFIGEQISYTANPLRRMDNPKVVGDPDTYGGTNWVNPDCTPTLANDQCGVHTNSNVLNKWFYLLTCGSGLGSGPDASYVQAAADDGINDLGNPYSVTGLGFNVSEQLAFLTEVMLTSTATYAEARSVSIATAKAYSGDPCGSIVQSVTNSWYAVGVGSAFSTPCTVTYGFVFTAPLSVPEGRNGFGCNALDTLKIPVTIPANSTINITTGGTATLNVDYILIASSLNNPSASVKTDTIKLAIINDAVVEANETIDVTISVSNNGGNPVNTTYSVTIVDDDVVPVIGADSITLINENFESYPLGFNSPTGWTETLEIPEDPALDPQVNGKNQWGVFQMNSPSNTTKALAITGRLDASGTGTLPGGTYINTSTSQTRITPGMMDARGLHGIHIKFDYTVQGEVDPNGVDPEQYSKLDYMALAYSFDGVNYTELGPQYTFASAVPVSGTFNADLPAKLDNKQFYLAFRWVNDPLIGGPVSVSVDNLVLKAVPAKIETQLNNAGNERINGAQEVYFYSANDREIIAKINTSGSHNYGCVTATLEKAGNSAFTLYTDANENHKVGDKVVRVTPTTNNSAGTYTISLYLTEQEIIAIETATAQPRNAFYMYKTSAANYTGANSSNTSRVAAGYTAIAGGAGGIFTASFSTGFSAFAVGAVSSGALPVSCLSFTGTRTATGVKLNWSVAQEVNNKKFTIERSSDGTRFSDLVTIAADTRNGGMYSTEDNNLVGLSTVYYRLKQVDVSGAESYICNVVNLRVSKDKVFTIGNIYPNPVKDKAMVKITTSENMKLNVEVLNGIGQMVGRQMQQLAVGSNNIQLPLAPASSGNYLVRFKDENGNVLGTQTIFIK